jgi:hypothetical protein
MASPAVRNSATSRSPDPRNRLIATLLAQLKAERETRDALEFAIRNGATASEVLDAIASDPVPALPTENVTSEDLAAIEQAISDIRLDTGTKGR